MTTMSSGWDSAADNTTGESSSSPRPVAAAATAYHHHISSIAVAVPVAPVFVPSSASSASSAAAPSSSSTPRHNRRGMVEPPEVMMPNSANQQQHRRRLRRRARSPSPPTSPERGSGASSSRGGGGGRHAGDLSNRQFHSDPRHQQYYHLPPSSAAGGGGEHGHMSFTELLEAMISSCGGEWHAGGHHSSSSPGGISHHTYPRRLEKVKFGVPVDEVCRRCNGQLPASLLILLLKLNKQGPHRKDVFRAPGHQASVKSLIGFLQHGRLVNIDNFSVFTLASVLKKFLRKLPGGVFGAENEAMLASFEEDKTLDVYRKREHIQKIIASLSIPTQRLLVLLFGTFNIIYLYAESSGSVYDHRSSAARPAAGWAAQALGVSVAPSLFVSLVPSGKQVKTADIQRFKTASDSIAFIIRNFSVGNMFGRANYEYYAHTTGRVLRVDDEWIFTFPFPVERQAILREKFLANNICLAQLEAIKWGIGDTVNSMSDPCGSLLPASALSTTSTASRHFDTTAEPATSSRLRTPKQQQQFAETTTIATYDKSTGTADAELPVLRRRIVDRMPPQRFSAQSAGAAVQPSSSASHVHFLSGVASSSLERHHHTAAVASMKSPSGGSATTQSSSATLTNSNSNGSTLVQTTSSTSSSTTTGTSGSSCSSSSSPNPLSVEAVGGNGVGDNNTRFDEVRMRKQRLGGSANPAAAGVGGGGAAEGNAQNNRQYKSHMSLPEIEERQKLLLAARSQWFLGSIFSSEREGRKNFRASAVPGEMSTAISSSSPATASLSTTSQPVAAAVSYRAFSSLPQKQQSVSAHSIRFSATEHLVPVVPVVQPPQQHSTSAHTSPANSTIRGGHEGRRQHGSSSPPTYLYRRYAADYDNNQPKDTTTTPSPPVSFSVHTRGGGRHQTTAAASSFSGISPLSATNVDRRGQTSFDGTVFKSHNNKKPRDESDSSAAEPLPPFAAGGGDTTDAAVEVVIVKRSPKRRPQLSPLILQLQRSLGAAVGGGLPSTMEQGSIITSSPSSVTLGNKQQQYATSTPQHVVARRMPASVSAYAVGDVITNSAASRSSNAGSQIVPTMQRKDNKKLMSVTSSSSSAAMSEADDCEMDLSVSSSIGGCGGKTVESGGGGGGRINSRASSAISSSVGGAAAARNAAFNAASGSSSSAQCHYHHQRMPSPAAAAAAAAAAVASAAAEQQQQTTSARPFNYLNPSGTLSIAATSSYAGEHWDEEPMVHAAHSRRSSAATQASESRPPQQQQACRVVRLLPAMTASPGETCSANVSFSGGGEIVRRGPPVTLSTTLPLHRLTPVSERISASEAHQPAQARAARFRASELLPGTTSSSSSATGVAAVAPQRIARVLPLNDQYAAAASSSSPLSPVLSGNSSPRVRCVPRKLD